MTLTTSSGGSAPATGTRRSLVAWTALGGIVLVGWAVQLSGWTTVFPWISVLVLLLAAAGVAVVAIAWSWRAPSSTAMAVTGLLLVSLVLVAVAVWGWLQVYSAPGYLTDELAFDQYAAHLLVHGLNPYSHSMAPAFAMFHVPPEYATFHLSGTPVTSLSYPSLAFLVYVPFLWAGWSTQVANAVNVGAWVLSIAMLHLMLPRRFKMLAVVVGSAAVYVGFAVGGVTDALFIPLLMGAAFAWDRFGERGGWRDAAGPVLLGLAMGVKQQPWLILPFVVAGVFLGATADRGAWGAVRLAGRYLGIALAAFLLPNLPFIVLAPGAWVRGVLTPLLGHTVPAGQGLVGLSLFTGIGGGSLAAYSVAAVAVFLLVLAAYVVTYPMMKPVAFVLPAIALLFASRSFGNYLVTLVPAGLIGALTVRTRSVPLPSRRGVVTLGLLGVVASVTVTWAIASPAPLRISITSVTTTGQLATVDQVEVRVTNRTRHSVRPAFTVETGNTVTSFWLRQGPASLRAGRTATYRLLAPDYFAQPPITGGFEVLAFTSNPATVSHTGAYRPTTDHVELTPDAVSVPVPVGHPVRITAQIVDDLDRPVRVAGVPIYIGQVIYAQSGLEYGQASIAGSAPGESPVVVPSGASGAATFTIRGTVATADPVYFEANLLNNSSFYPFGYSSILAIRFAEAAG